MSGLDIVVPSAAPIEGVLERTLPALRAAVDEGIDEPGEVVVVDDVAPRPDLAALTEQLGMRYVEGPGRGPGPARNLGARSGTAALICFVDDDVLLDRDAFIGVDDAFGEQQVVAVVGGLRPPQDAPTWLVETYTWATLTPASALAPEGVLPFVALATGLVIARRQAWAAAGGFPDALGIEDSLFGLRLAEACPAGRIVRRHRPSGVHLYLPSWEEWMERNWRSGRRLREILPTLTEEAQAVLLDARMLRGGSRAAFKRTCGLLPPRALLRLTGGPLRRRLAAAGAGARGFQGRPWTDDQGR